MNSMSTTMSLDTFDDAAQDEPIIRFIHEELVLTRIGPNRCRTSFTDLYRAYLAWCQRVGECPQSKKAVGQVLRAEGCEVRVDGEGRRVYAGVLLRAVYERVVVYPMYPPKVEPPAPVDPPKNETFDVIYRGELKVAGSPSRAFTRALAIYAFVEAASRFDKPSLPVPTSTVRLRRGALERAGVRPIVTPEELATIASSVGATSGLKLVRLLWTINDDRSQTLPAAVRRWRFLVEPALNILAQPTSRAGETGCGGEDTPQT